MRAVRCILSELDNVLGALLIHDYVFSRLPRYILRYNIWMNVCYTSIGTLYVPLWAISGYSRRGSMSTVSSRSCPCSHWAKSRHPEGATENCATPPRGCLDRV
jgi:hypothetical protein